MLSGTRPFSGETISETLAATIKDEPSWTALPGGLPSRVRELLKRTLEKDPRRRLRDIGDARLTLEDVQSGAGQTDAATNAKPESRATLQRLLPWALTAVATLAAVALGWRAFTPPPTAPALPALGTRCPSQETRLSGRALPTISPDGRHVAFVKNGTLWVAESARAASASPARAGAQFPFSSPDSLQVAYLTANCVGASASTEVSPSASRPTRFSKGDEHRAASGLRTTRSFSR